MVLLLRVIHNLRENKMCKGNGCPVENVAMLVQLVEEFKSTLGQDKSENPSSPREPGQLPKPDPRLVDLIMERADMKVQFDLLYNSMLAAIGGGAGGSSAYATGLQPDVVAKRYYTERCG